MPVVTVSLREGKKNTSTINAGLTFLWYIRSTDSMVMRKHTITYERRMCYNGYEYSTASGAYCTTYNANVPFFMPWFSIIKIIVYLFCVDNN